LGALNLSRPVGKLKTDYKANQMAIGRAVWLSVLTSLQWVSDANGK